MLKVSSKYDFVCTYNKNIFGKMMWFLTCKNEKIPYKQKKFKKGRELEARKGHGNSEKVEFHIIRSSPSMHIA